MLQKVWITLQNRMLLLQKKVSAPQAQSILAGSSEVDPSPNDKMKENAEFNQQIFELYFSSLNLKK